MDKEVTLHDIPDVASDMLDKLGELNINSVYQLAVQNPSELAWELSNNFVDIHSAARLIANARKILTENEILSKEFLTADDLLVRRNKISRYKTGSSNFDSFLNGGIETQSITEIAGEFGSGKTQICHTLCTAAIALMEDDLDTSINDRIQKVPRSVIFIDTENTFHANRVHQIAEQKNLDPEDILKRIYHCNVYSSEQLEAVIDNLPKYIEQYNSKLVIVDSIISLHRAEFSGQGTLTERQQRLGKMLNKLRRYADIYNIAVVITNQVVSYAADSSHPRFDYMKAAGGNIVGHGSTYRIFLKRAGKNRTAIMQDSPSHPYQRVKFTISENGIEDANSYKREEESELGW